MVRTLEKIITYAAAVAEPEQIILFGSMAANNANQFSDVDLLIITTNVAVKKEAANKIVSYSNELSLKTDVLIYTQEQIIKEIAVKNSFLGGIYKAGKVVWKK